ncbi:MAG: ATP-dependent RecD-like DNA helicase [Myxococcota bacterium]
MADAEEELTCTVERVVYHDARSRYTVLRVLAPGHDTLVTAVGRMVSVEAGAELTLRGRWDEHPQHGRQFAIVGMKVAVPTTKLGIERRLMRYPGVKAVMASRIVAKFGMETLAIIEQQPRRLLEVDGIGARTLERIVDHHAAHSGPMAQIEAQLLELDLPVHLASAIHARYGDDGINVLRKHPYRLAREVRGIGFATADRVARALGIEPDSAERLDAGLVHVLEQAEMDGHCALPIEQLVEQAMRNLGAPEYAVRDAGERLVVSGEVVLEHGNDGTPLAFPARMLEAERDVAIGLAALARGISPAWSVPELPSHLSAGQADAVRAVAEHGVVVLTGGPGTGKSTVVAQVLELAQANAVPVMLAAPTGRAAKRLEQTTGHAASTLHRLLEFQPETGAFSHGPADPLPPGLLVVDESSMVDVHLGAALVGALTPAHRLLLVGDADQLPSVGPGNVLRDVMAVAEEEDTPLALVRLTEVFRQGAGSSIISNANRVLNGDALAPDPSGSEGGEFFVVATRTAQRVHDLAVRMATERIPAAYGLDGRTDVQVLVPMHKGIAGTENLNRSLQAHFTAGQKEWTLGGKSAQRRTFRRTDRVMQTRNDYEKSVFNGDIGEVVLVDAEEGKLVVDFDGQRVTYEGRETNALQLAYALSIHKSQGSEFPAVIVCLLPEHHVMLRRNLLYTAVTRAKTLCVVVGDSRAIERAIGSAADNSRFTALARRIKESLDAPPTLFDDVSEEDFDDGDPGVERDVAPIEDDIDA